ncbi:hypothetical protein ACP70R_031059 [Stipagrostis hirtigluma subsp. patula]
MAEREGNAAAAGSGAGRWGASPDGVIMLPAGSVAWPNRQHHTQREHQEEQQQPAGYWSPARAGVAVEFAEQPEKVFYKTKLCEKFEAGGRCMYEDGCTFAHGVAELRPPLPLPALAARRRPVPAAAGEHGDGPRAVNGGFFGKVYFEFRDKGSCHWGDKCAFAHVSAAEVAEMRFAGGPRQVEHARRSATPPGAGRAYSPGGAAVPATSRGSGSIYALLATARAFPPAAPAAAAQGEAKVSRLELLSCKRVGGIYGDWPEEK